MKYGIRPVEIVGGGLAGLSLGIALRRHGIPVTVFEAGGYPRHKVCGEFIAGLCLETVKALGIADDLSDAIEHRQVAWMQGGRVFRRDKLPRPALGISRHLLDQRLALRFEEAGGRLETGRRIGGKDGAIEGRVWAVGRRRSASDWIGLKAHCVGLTLASDLEVHLADDAYVGASAVEGDRVNVCGLFRVRAVESSGRSSILLDYLEASGLGDLARRLLEAEVDDASATAVAALEFGVMPNPEGNLRIGDAYALIPPFTGDGMAMAFEGAADAAYPVAQYAYGRIEWRDAVTAVERRLRRRFRRRLSAAQAMHPLLYRRQGQALFRLSSSSRLLPFRRIFQLLHS